MRKKAKLKVLLYTVLFAVIFKLILNMLGFTTWYVLGEKMLTAFQTSFLYYGIVIMGLIIYLTFYHAKYKLIHTLCLSLLPVSFFVGFCVYTMPILYVVVCACFMFLITLDLHDIVPLIHRVHGPLKKKYRNRCMSIVIKNFMQMSVYLTVISMMILYSITGKWMFISFGGSQYKALFQEEEEGAIYATNVRDLYATTGTNLWENNKDKLVELRSDRYIKKTIEERVNAFQEVLNIDCEYLGIKPIQLRVMDIPGNSTWGYFSSEKNTITLDESLLEKNNKEDALHTILHEVYHYYTYTCSMEMDKLEKAGINMDLLFARDIRKWYEEYNDYSSAIGSSTKEEYYKYASQHVELSADEYAATWSRPYLNYIENIKDDELVD